MKLLALSAALLGATALSACGGGGGSTNAGGALPPKVLAIYAVPDSGGAGSGPFAATEMEAFRAAIVALEDDIFSGTTTTALPSAASATMTGLVGGQPGVGSSDYIAGKLTLNADFVNATIGGSTSDFSRFDVSDAANPVRAENLSGALSIADGTIFGNQFFFTDIDGSLTGAAGDYVVDAELDGLLMEIDGAVGTQGLLVGTIAAPGAAAVDIENGLFGASE